MILSNFVNYSLFTSCFQKAHISFWLPNLHCILLAYRIKLLHIIVEGFVNLNSIHTLHLMSRPFDFSFHQCIPATIHPGYAGLFHIFQIYELLLELCTCCPFAWNTFILPLSLHPSTYPSSEFSLSSWGKRNLEKQSICAKHPNTDTDFLPQHSIWASSSVGSVIFSDIKCTTSWSSSFHIVINLTFETPERTRLEKYNSFSKV